MNTFSCLIITIFYLRQYSTAFAAPPPQFLTLTNPSSKISPLVLDELNQNDNKHTADILISFHNSDTSTILKQTLRGQIFANRGAKINAIKSALEEYASSFQTEILQFLANKNSIHVRTLWISNQIILKGATYSLVQELATFNSVSQISLDEKIMLDLPIEVLPGHRPFRSNNGTTGAAVTAEWGILNIQAPEAWALPNGGNAGQGVIVATVDTGVRYTHESLHSNYVGNGYGWFDPYDHTSTPIDKHGHGTHTMGSIVGKGGIGVAHEAKWMSCRGCESGRCSNSGLLECGQFIVCPTRPDGSEADCSKAPHLVSNSWGTVPGSSFYNPVIDAYHAANIIPIFCIGNSGSNGCSSCWAPGDQHTIGVGAITSTNELAHFSSIGPSWYGDLKPNVVAPGENVNSAYHTSDTAYSRMSGTSMATPHTAGLVALLKSADLTLTFDYVLLYLYRGADTTSIQPTGQTCGYIRDDEIPNNSFGYGKINALRSLKLLLHDLSIKS